MKYCLQNGKQKTFQSLEQQDALKCLLFWQEQKAIQYMHGDKKDPSVPSFAFPIFSETATCQNYLIKSYLSYIPSISPDYFSSSLFVIYESDQEFHDFQAPNYGS